jgi:hypothetical protein
VHIARHDCFVDLIASEVKQVVSPTAHMQKHYCVRGSWFDVDNVFFCVPNTPDIVVVGGRGRCSFYGFMDQAFVEKLLKYQPLVACLESLRCR